MARRTITQYFDDLTGDPLPDDQINSINFSMDGTEYVIDLSDDNAAEFRALMDLYIEVAQRIPRPRKTRRTRKTATQES